VNIAATEFNQWLESIAPDVPLRDICTQANLSLSTISEQRSGNRITPNTVISISRAQGLNPAHQLATFLEFESLKTFDLSLKDAVPLCSALELLHHWFVREGKAQPGLAFTVPEARLKRWLEMNRHKASHKDLAYYLEMQPSNFSRQITDGSLPVYRIINLASYLGVSPLPGLIAADYLLFEEVFGQSIQNLLSSTSDQELVRAIEQAGPFLSVDMTHFTSH